MPARRLVRRALILVGTWACLASAGQAQEPHKVKVELTVEQAMLIVQTLGQVTCPNVAAMATCEAARDTIKTIQEQARSQVK